MKSEQPSTGLMQLTVIVRPHDLPRSEKKHRALLIVIDATTIFESTTVRVFHQDSIQIIEFRTEMYRISLSRIDDRNQRMQRFHTEIIVVLLHSVYSLYLIHLQLYLASIAKITFSFIRFSPSDEIGYYICGIDTVYTPNNRYFCN